MPTTSGRVSGLPTASNEKTVIRGGYGIFYGAQAYQTDFLGTVGTYNSVTSYSGTIDNGATPFTTLADPFPAGVRKPQGSEVGLAAQYGDSLTMFTQNRVNPYNQQWQLSVQRVFPGEMVIEAAYLGMQSLKGLQSFNLNEKPDQYLALGAAENTRVTNPFLGIFSPTSTLGTGATITQGQLWKRYPQYVTLTQEGANTGRSIYHALQSKVEKRLQHGLDFLWSYTYSKLINNNTTSLINERHYRAVSPNDRTHSARLTARVRSAFRARESAAEVTRRNRCTVGGRLGAVRSDQLRLRSAVGVYPSQWPAHCPVEPLKERRRFESHWR